MLSRETILEKPVDAGVRNVDIARALGLSETRASEIRHGKRRMTLEEAGLLIRTFALEPGLPRAPLIRTTAMPTDTNPYGGVFGGWLMGQMGLACGSFASRHSAGKAILVAADGLKFPGAMAVGDELSVYVDLLKQGRTSLRLKAEAVGRARDGDLETLVAEGEFTFVALDQNNRPRPIAAEEASNA